jgi:hypothetical protein
MRLALISTAALSLLSVQSTAAPSHWVLTSHGLGPLRIGMTKAQAWKALGHVVALNHDASGSEACEEGEWLGQAGVQLRFESGALSVIDVSGGSRIATDKGLRVGDTEAKVLTAYGPALEIEPAVYDDPPAHYLTAWDPASGRGIRYTTDHHGAITEIGAGDDSIRSIEGCA